MHISRPLQGTSISNKQLQSSDKLGQPIPAVLLNPGHLLASPGEHEKQQHQQQLLSKPHPAPIKSASLELAWPWVLF